LAPDSALTEEDIRAFARSRLAPYKVPKTVELIELIPRSDAMKLSRSAFVAEREGPDDDSGAGAGVGPGARSGS